MSDTQYEDSVISPNHNLNRGGENVAEDHARSADESLVVGDTSQRSGIAILHHRYKKYGGGERVADQLAAALDADLYTLYVTDDTREETPATPLQQNKYSGLTGRFYRRLAIENIARSIDLEHVALDDYETVITTGDFAHCYQPTDEQRHIHYLHTPNRDMYNPPEYRELAGGRLRWLKTLYFQWLRGRDKNHVHHVDHWLANSEFIADRARRHYGLEDSTLSVVNPPVNWEAFGPARPADERNDYWVTVGRLVPAKRLDVLVDAFSDRDDRLVIAGDGPDRQRLADDAPDNVTFAGYVADAKKYELVRHARGFLFMGERECFGMAVAEALAAGTPVVGAASGNIPNMVHTDENGVLARANPAAVNDALDRATEQAWNHNAIREDAQQYSRARFVQEVQEVVY